jgi:3-methylfumaryl-CoA hydratase
MFDDRLGRTWIQSDILTAGLAGRFRSTVAGAAGEAPDGIHWCLGLPAVEADELGEDGHVRKGIDLPPIPLPRRMWASGDIAFHAPLTAGVPISCERTIKDIQEKSGSTGQLYFVTLLHRYLASSQLCIEETRIIVYREASGGRPTVPDPLRDAAATVVTDPVTLFRYSALTFNGHRIHYDQPYATAVEHYPGIVVHGPLQASWLMQLARRRMPMMRHFSYRALNPLIVGTPARLTCVADGRKADLQVQTEEGIVTMKATAE